jgi:hypothetical protein
LASEANSTRNDNTLKNTHMIDETEETAPEESVDQILYDKLFGHPKLQEILKGQSLDDFVEERVDVYYMELNADLSSGVSHDDAKAHALKSLLKGI